LVSDELVELRQLVRSSDSIELKVTVPEQSQRSANKVLGIDPLQAQIRQVFFFDTPDLTLNEAGVVVRARRIQGRDHDSVIKLRPVVPDQLPDELRADPNFVVEVDALPGGYMCSGSLKGALPPDVIHKAVSGERPLRKLFNKAQRAFYAAHAPDCLELDDLSVLGPIFVLKVKVTPPELRQRLVGEMWLYPDGSRIVELSTKCLPGQGMDVGGRRARLPRGQGTRPARRPADEDQDGARVLLRRAARRRARQRLTGARQQAAGRRRPSARMRGRSCDRCAGHDRAASRGRCPGAPVGSP
jgi:hypothetical protein